VTTSCSVAPTQLSAGRGEQIGARKPLKVLLASHSHPRLSKGGAEIVAYELFSALRTRPDYEPSFLGCVHAEMNQKMGATINQPFSECEYLYCGGAFDWFKFANTDPNFPREFRSLLQELQPRIVHFHHYIRFGVEAFLHVRETLPDCKIILTLHEYLAVCHYFGQMVTKQNRTLCYEASPTRCTGCFTEISPSDFFLRKLYIQRFFKLVDHFIAPSEFLAERYVAWGVPQDRVSVIENVIRPPLDNQATAVTRNTNNLLRIGFFGQISPLKGINVLFDAAEILLERDIHNVVFEVYGDYSGQPPEFQADFLARLAKIGLNVKFQGAYDQNRVDKLMQSVDVIVVPSIWWENSPVIIQEALRNRRPIICSDIGGMAEKVRDGADGFHFPVGNSVALASLLMQLVEKPSKLADVVATMRSPIALEDITTQYTKLYGSLL
jgi:glycosyltransferase involved in cell wall biosynthesis